VVRADFAGRRVAAPVVEAALHAPLHLLHDFLVLQLHAIELWEERLETPAKIFYKYEGVSPTGSHKPNTSVPQAYFNAEAGTTRLTTETGAGDLEDFALPEEEIDESLAAVPEVR